MAGRNGEKEKLVDGTKKIKKSNYGPAEPTSEHPSLNVPAEDIETPTNTVTCQACSTVIYKDTGTPLNRDGSENRDHSVPREGTVHKVIVGTCIVIIGIAFVLQMCRLVLLGKLIDLELNNSTSDRTNIDILLNITSQSVYVLEYFTLFHGLILLLIYYRNPKNKRVQMWTTTTRYLKNMKCCCKYSESDPDVVDQRKFSVCQIIWLVVLVIVLELVHVTISMLPPSFLVRWKNETILFFPNYGKKAIGYAALAFPDHVYAFLTRSAMAYVTLFVISAWREAEANINKEKAGMKERDQISADDKVVEKAERKQLDEKKISKMVKFLAKEYHSTGMRVDAVQNIFQGWFVIKWVIYFIDIIGHSILAAEILFSDRNYKEVHEEHQLAHILSHLVYDFLAFFFLFICGAFMNHYHDKYRKTQAKVQQKILSKNTYTSIIQYSDSLISEVPEYQFLPSILWIDFPLNSPGYTLTMLLALFAFVANFLTQYDVV